MSENKDVMAAEIKNEIVFTPLARTMNERLEITPAMMEQVKVLSM